MSRQNPARRDLDEVPPPSNMDPVTTEASPDVAPAVHVPEANLPLLLNSDAAAGFLGVGRATLYRLDMAGRVPRPIHLGRLRRWSRPELRRWVEAGCPARERWESKR
jgi:predicted DNA-binding transcriptional regulator AlpA